MTALPNTTVTRRTSNENGELVEYADGSAVYRGIVSAGDYGVFKVVSLLPKPTSIVTPAECWDFLTAASTAQADRLRGASAGEGGVE